MIGSYFDLIGRPFSETKMMWSSLSDFECCVDRLIFADHFDENSEHDVQLRAFLMASARSGDWGPTTLEMSEDYLWPLAEKLEEERLKAYWPLKNDLEGALKYFGPEGKLGLGWDLQELPDGRRIARALKDFLSERLNPDQNVIYAAVQDIKCLELLHLALELSRRSLLAIPTGLIEAEENCSTSPLCLPETLIEGNFYYLHATGFNYTQPLLHVISTLFDTPKKVRESIPEFEGAIPVFGEEILDPAPYLWDLGKIGRVIQLQLFAAAGAFDEDDYSYEKEIYSEREVARRKKNRLERRRLVETMGEAWQSLAGKKLIVPNGEAAPPRLILPVGRIAPTSQAQPVPQEWHEREAPKVTLEWMLSLYYACFKRLHNEVDSGSPRYLHGRQDLTVLPDGSVDVPVDAPVDEFCSENGCFYAFRNEDTGSIWLFTPDQYFAFLVEEMPEDLTFQEYEDSNYWASKPYDAKRIERAGAGMVRLDCELCESAGLEPSGEAIVVGAVNHLEIWSKAAFEKLQDDFRAQLNDLLS